MSPPVKKLPLTVAEYLRIEREAPYKSEYYGGEMFSMAGGTARHSLLAANIGGILAAHLRGHRCTAYTSDLRIGIPGDDLYTYPDVSIFCEPMTFLPGTDDTATIRPSSSKSFPRPPRPTTAGKSSSTPASFRACANTCSSRRTRRSSSGSRAKATTAGCSRPRVGSTPCCPCR